MAAATGTSASTVRDDDVPAVPDTTVPLAENAAAAEKVIGAMWRIRLFEEAVDELFARGLMHGTMHLSIGQEASATGVCLAMRPGDHLTSTHRGHGHCIAAGADLDRMMAELLAKETGYCRGRGGSMHIADVGTGNLGANGIVGGGIPIAVGAALGLRMQGKDAVVVSFFGDGATNEGAFHEAREPGRGVGPAGGVRLREQPVRHVRCPPSAPPRSAVSPTARRLRHPRGQRRRQRRPGRRSSVATAAIERARSGGGPTLIEAVTYRWKGHSKSDKNLYRTREEIEEWREKDPIAAFLATVTAAGTLDDATLARIAQEARDAVRESVRTGNAAPPSRADELLSAVYAPARRSLSMTTTTAAPTATAPSLLARHHLRRGRPGGHRRGHGRRPSVFMLGEDIGVYGGAFGVTGDLYHRFGAERIRDTPISELGIVGAAVGAALVGMKPDRGDPVLRLHRPGDGPDRQPGRQDPLHAGRRGARAAGAAGARWLRHRGGRAALAVAGGVVRPRPRPQGRHARDPGRRQGPAAAPRSTTPTR